MEPIELIYKLREGIDDTNFKISELQDLLSAGKLSLKKLKKEKEKLQRYISELETRIEVLTKNLSPLQKYLLSQTDAVLEEYPAEFDPKQIGILKVLFLLDEETHFIVQIDFRNPKNIKVQFPPDLQELIGSPDVLQALKESPPEGPQIKALLDEIQVKLNEKQEIFHEIEMINEFFNVAEMPSKTRAKVILYGLDMREFPLEVDVSTHPKPPKIKLSPSLQNYINVENLMTIRRWNPRENHAFQVIQEISFILDRNLRIERELKLLKKAKIPATYDSINGIIRVELQESPQSQKLTFLVKLPARYPHEAPLVEQLSPSTNETLNEKILERLNQATSEYLELQYLADVFSEILDIMKEHSDFVCAECKQFKCPTCGKDLFSSIPGVIGENNCFRRTPCCNATLHECCWKFFIQRDQKCPICGATMSRL
ncbi:MAG: hypothetical protein ACXQS8_07780 [Candidatus Helarchaeales archaeon]